MIVLYLLTAHMVGDFVIQNRWMAAFKLSDWKIRTIHVFTYSIPFSPIMGFYSNSPLDGFLFGFLLYLLHYATDSHRFRSTLGDVVQWQISRRTEPAAVRRAWVDHLYGGAGDEALLESWELDIRKREARDIAGRTLWMPPPNPWSATPLMIDQTLHICQLALLGGLFLS